jgi:hypothetical protein
VKLPILCTPLSWPHFLSRPSLLFPLKVEPEPKKHPTVDDVTDVVSPLLPPGETTLAIGGLLCGNLPLPMRNSRQVSDGMPHFSHSLTPLLLAIFGIGFIAVPLLGMGLLLLAKMHHQDIGTVLFVLVAIGALYVIYRSTGTLREVRSLRFLLLSTLSTHPSSSSYSSSSCCDQRDEHTTQQDEDKEIPANTAFRHCLLHKDLPRGLINLFMLSPNIYVRGN